MDINTIEKNHISGAMLELNKDFSNVELVIGCNFRHILQRSKERNIDVCDVVYAITHTNKNLTCQLIYLMNLPSVEAPFRVFINKGPVILVLSKQDDRWSLNTVLDSKKHNLRGDESSSTFYAYL